MPELTQALSVILFLGVSSLAGPLDENRNNDPCVLYRKIKSDPIAWERIITSGKIPCPKEIDPEEWRKKVPACASFKKDLATLPSILHNAFDIVKKQDISVGGNCDCDEEDLKDYDDDVAASKRLKQKPARPQKAKDTHTESIMTANPNQSSPSDSVPAVEESDMVAAASDIRTPNSTPGSSELPASVYKDLLPPPDFNKANTASPEKSNETPPEKPAVSVIEKGVLVSPAAQPKLETDRNPPVDTVASSPLVPKPDELGQSSTESIKPLPISNESPGLPSKIQDQALSELPKSQDEIPPAQNSQMESKQSDKTDIPPQAASNGNLHVDGDQAQTKEKQEVVATTKTDIKGPGETKDLQRETTTRPTSDNDNILDELALWMNKYDFRRPGLKHNLAEGLPDDVDLGEFIWNDECGCWKFDAEET